MEKPELITEEQARTYAAWFAALGDPTRVRLLRLLARAGRPMAVGELVAQVEIGQSTVSHHLRILTEARFVLSEKQGTSTLCSVNPACLTAFPHAVRAIVGGPSRETGAEFAVAPMTADHAEQVLAIYQAGIDEGDATFETAAPTWEVFDAGRLPAHRFVALGEAGVLGWTAASAVSDRRVYAGVVEHSVYVHPEARGRGVAHALLTALIDSTEAAGIWTIQSGIFPENTASLALHRRAGFRVIGRRERVGRHHGRWRDTVLLERRSQAVG